MKRYQVLRLENVTKAEGKESGDAVPVAEADTLIRAAVLAGRDAKKQAAPETASYAVRDKKRTGALLLPGRPRPEKASWSAARDAFLREIA
jgi:hypothetical protein